MRFAYNLAALFVCASALGAQGSGATLVATVRDASDSGVVGYAEVRVASIISRRTDGLGRIRIEGLPIGPAEVTVRIVGYSPLVLHQRLEAGENQLGNLFLARIPALLSQVTVRGRTMRVPSGFERIYERARGSFGQFLTREQIDSLNPTTIADLLTTQSHLRVRESNSQTFIQVRGCTATLWVNGLQVNSPDAVQMALKSYHPSALQVVEAYDGPTRIPPEFRTNMSDGRSACAVVLIWTRAR